MTTHEKLAQLVETISNIRPDQLPDDIRELVSNFQAVRGLASLAGVAIPANPLAMVLPDDPADADILVDKLIALLFEIRGDDLPPFDPNRYGEAFIAGILGDEPEERAAA